MDRIVLIGLNHKTAPIEIREKFAVICVDTKGPLESLSQLRALKEAIYLSTCNRMEVLFTTARLDEGIGAAVWIQWW
jgi:glutamyl-tRNA reductase